MLRKVRKYRKYVINYSIVFVIIAACIFFPFLFFGKTLIYGNGDAFHQHYLIFQHFISLIKDSFFNLFTIDWNIGLGNDVIGQFGYYIIGDIFSYIGVLFPKHSLKYVYSFLIVLRIYFIGLSFIIYSISHKIKYKHAVIGAVVYAFSSFSLIAGVFHPYFLNAAILFPLFILATEKVIDDNKISLFSFLTFISLICNFYFAYKLLILSLIYGFVYYFNNYKNDNFIEKIKIMFVHIGHAAIAVIVGVCMSAVILLPVVYTFLNTSRIGSNVNVLRSFELDYYLTLFSGIITTQNIHWTTIGTCCISLLALIHSFFNFKRNKIFCVYFILLSLILMVPFFGSIMNGFSYPTHRWSFAFAFVMAHMVIILQVDKYYFSSVEKKFMIFFIVVYSFFFIFYNRHSLIEYSIYLILLISILFIVLFFQKKRIFNRLILFCVCINCIFLGTELYFFSGEESKPLVDYCLPQKNTFQRYNTIDGTLKGFDLAIKKLKEIDPTYYRIGFVRNNINNLSLLYNYNSLSEYLSLANGHLSKMSYTLNNIDYGISKPLKQLNNRTKITTLLSTKYYFSNKKDVELVPYGYEKLFTVEDTVVFKNKYYLPILTGYSHYQDIRKYDNENLEFEEVIFNDVLVDEKDINLISPSTEYKTIFNNLNFSLKSSSGISITDKEVIVTDTTGKIYLKTENVKNSEIYILFSNLYLNNSKNSSKDYKINLNCGNKNISKSIEDSEKSQYYVDMPYKFINLGYFDEVSDKITISFSKKGIYSLDDLKIIVFSMDDYENQVRKLQEGLYDITINKNTIEAIVDKNSDSIIQLSTGYSKGWKVYVDGERKKVIKCNGGFLGVEIPKGNHKLKFKYDTPFLKIGSLISVCGIIFFIVIKNIENKNHH